MSAWVSPSIVADQYSASPFQGQLVEVAAQTANQREPPTCSHVGVAGLGKATRRGGPGVAGAGGGGEREEAGPVLVNSSILMSERGT